MKLLLDFMNVKEWNYEVLLSLFKKHGIKWSMEGYRVGYEMSFRSSAFPDRSYFFEPDHYYQELVKCGADAAAPADTEKYKAFFTHFDAVLQMWNDIVLNTIEHGPDIEIINQIIYEAKFKMVAEPGSRGIDLSYSHSNSGFIEDVLEQDYLKTFLNHHGEMFKKLKTCAKPECGKWFIYQRSTKKYCCDKCRRDQDNRNKIKSGYLSAHQKKQRDKGIPAYFR